MFPKFWNLFKTTLNQETNQKSYFPQAKLSPINVFQLKTVSSKITLIYSILYIIDDVLICKSSYVIFFQFVCSKNFILIQVLTLLIKMQRLSFHHMHNP